MWKLVSQLIKITPLATGLFLFVAQSTLAESLPSSESEVISPQEALGILQNRPELKTPLNQDKSKQFRDGTSNHPMSQVTSISELQDVSPTDWAYEALRSLVERYGCIVGYPDRTFRGNRATSRWEFAAGLNACLNTIERLLQENVAVLREDLEKLKRLAQEFEQELAALGARVGNLEERVSFLEDHQFSTTTQLKGEVLFTLSSAAGERALDAREQDLFNQGRLRGERRRIDDNATLGFRTRLNLDTSFTGKDRLRTRIEAGNIVNYANFTGTDMARLGHDIFNDANARIGDLYYRFSVGNLTTWVGANSLDIDDIFDVGNPFLASSGTGGLSRFIRYNPLVFRGPEGIGGGFAYQLFDNLVVIRGLYLTENGNSPDLGEGMFNGNYSAGGQLGIYPADNLDFTFTYLLSYFTEDDVNAASSNGSSVESNFRTSQTGRGVSRDPFLGAATLRDSYGIQGDWRINEMFHLTAWGGYALARAQGEDLNGENRRGFGADLWTWSAALSVVDFGKEGAVLSVAGGQYVTARRIDAIPGDLAVPDKDTPYIIETQYKYPLNDNILLTPGFYVVLRPDGNELNNSIWVGAIRTTFTF
ncbi:iron uptake porin [Crocosphaera sp. UHCC 0190]|uniref:iron uptake porin n=1 Tax=Crocosphaera sp. UHCC 0190 TaxID=3110246 RepID=UPI002B1F1C82|nr:iron uptake porin [Crocosphaera sp. UHCC 0190]MEA5512228.1 iron uptake porin [Crocosphaera sp. UHCC 0190]